METTRRVPPCPDGERPWERACWLALSRLPGLGLVGAWKRVADRGSARAAWAEPPPGAGGSAAAPREAARRLEPLRLLEEAERGGVRVVTPADEDYPDGLLDLHDPPLALYVRGVAPLAEPPTGPKGVAVVGSRQANPYGLAQAESLSRELASRGLRVLSGLARGVDGAAHRGSLSGGGPTLAVLGCGLDVEYPREHRRLRQQIEACGAVVSEYPAGTGPEPWHFPARNRILAALAGAVVVVQAARRSGALITADLAMELGREVLAIPGPLGWPQSEGCLQLLAEGAALVRSAQDVLDALGVFTSPAPAPPPRPEGPPRAVLEALGCEGAPVDAVVERTGLAPGQVASLLVRLEVEGRVRRLPHGVWIPV